MSLKMLQQRSRRARRDAAAAPAPSSILRRPDRQRNNTRRIEFSTICTAKPFDKQQPPENLVSGFPEVEQQIPCVVVVEAQPQKEEEGVQFGNDAGPLAEEPIEQRKLTGLRREVAALASQLGGYWDVDTSVRRVRKKPDRFMP
mmetsp:Transcript_17006/g.27915  ORF Transcript_17006/g.27915 Transcript_17006/m.27915 type:complete len:144 (-) Transcript_17006:78-509(-)